jgi:hypothetical protein
VCIAFRPHLEILPPAQRRLWDELGALPSEFVLYGGTAVALHLGHRASLDFDFFGWNAFDPDGLYRSLSFLHGAEVLQKAADTLTCLVDRGGAVRMSFFDVPGLGGVMSTAVRQRLTQAVKSVRLDRLPDLDRLRRLPPSRSFGR